MAQHLSHGADVERLDDIAVALRRQSDAVAEIGARGATLLERLRVLWQGPDFERFAGEWRAARRTIEGAETQLRVYSRKAGAASELQRSASGGSSGDGGRPGQVFRRPDDGQPVGAREAEPPRAAFLPTVPLAVPPRLEGELVGESTWSGPAFQRLELGVYPPVGPAEPSSSWIPGERGVAFDPTQTSRVAPLRRAPEGGEWLHVHEH